MPVKVNVEPSNLKLEPWKKSQEVENKLSALYNCAAQNKKQTQNRKLVTNHAVFYFIYRCVLFNIVEEGLTMNAFLDDATHRRLSMSGLSLLT